MFINKLLGIWWYSIHENLVSKCLPLFALSLIHRVITVQYLDHSPLRSWVWTRKTEDSEMWGSSVGRRTQGGDTERSRWWWEDQVWETEHRPDHWIKSMDNRQSLSHRPLVFSIHVLSLFGSVRCRVLLCVFRGQISFGVIGVYPPTETLTCRKPERPRRSG